MGHAARVATDADHTATVLSVDGIGAYDHVFRASMMAKLLEVPRLRRLLPFVRRNRAVHHRATLGKMRKDGRIRFGSTRGANRVIHSCHCCSVWPSTMLSRR